MNRARSLVGREMNRSYSPEHFAISGTDEAKVAATCWLRASGPSESGAAGDHCCRTRQAV